MRSPVNAPGPRPNARPSRSASAMPASSSKLSTIGSTNSAWPRSVSWKRKRKLAVEQQRDGAGFGGGVEGQQTHGKRIADSG